MSAYSGWSAADVSRLIVRADALAAERDALLARVDELTEALRREWWMNHGCSYPAMYGDDGEMQCANGRPYHLPLDFKRMPLDELRAAVRDARIARAAAVDGTAPEPEGFVTFEEATREEYQRRWNQEAGSGSRAEETR